MQDLTIVAKKPQLKVSEFSVACHHEAAAEHSIRLIANKNSPYKFESKRPDPRIIDVGCGIGISVLYFKSLYPQSKILCFEPSQHSFKTLQKNLTRNKLEGVECIHEAIASVDGTGRLFGQDFSRNKADPRCNSMLEVWGSRYKENDSTEVKTAKLSRYITQPIDFLKLDAVGQEEQILVELEAEAKLPLVNEMVIDVYQATRTKPFNSLARIFALLRQNHFEITVTEKDSLFMLENEYTRQWAKKIKPQLFTVRALLLQK